MAGSIAPRSSGEGSTPEKMTPLFRRTGSETEALGASK